MGIDYANGWDACIATTFDQVNALLTDAYQNQVTPHQGEGQFNVPLGPVTVAAQVEATLGAWTMTGGTGQNVVIDVPFTGGTATIGTETYALAELSLEVIVLLRFVKSTLLSGESTYQLGIDLSDSSAIVAVSLINPPPNLTQDEQSALSITLQNLLQSSLAGRPVVVVATLNLSAINSSYPWLMPNNGIDYAASSTAAGQGAIAVLLATVNPVPDAPPTLVDGTIPAGCSAALILSNRLFTQQFLAPALASSLGVATSQIGFGSINPMVASFNGSASASGGTITSAVAVANNNVTTLTLNGNASPMAGVTVNFTINATYTLQLGGTPQQPVLTFRRISENENHSTDIAWWVWLLAGITGGVIGAAVAAIIQAVVNSTASNSLSGLLPVTFANVIAWPFSGTVTITQANLPLPLQLGGTVSSS